MINREDNGSPSCYFGKFQKRKDDSPSFCLVLEGDRTLKDRDLIANYYITQLVSIAIYFLVIPLIHLRRE